MPTAHLIDELVFDCSLDSTVIASNHESALSAWVSDGLLPAIDEVLNEFDEAEALWCLDCVEIDLGEVSSDNFYAELVQRVQDKLREQLRIARQNCLLPDFESIEPLPVRRLNNIQRDLEKLHVFLLTGNMPWHVNTKDAQVHEKILRNVLQEAGTSLISLTRRLSVADRALFIKRLASQFPKHHLENVLIRIAPTQADWILDFLCVYQSAILNTDFIPSVHAELSNSVWEQLFAFFLEENQDGDHPTQSLSKLIKRLSLAQKQDPNLLMSKLAQAAERSMREGQIKSALVTALQALIPDMPAISVQNQTSEKALVLDTQVVAIADTRQRQSAGEPLHLRILTALHEAGLIAVIADFSSDTTQAGIEQLTQHLRSLIRSPGQLAQWVNRLAQPVLLDITYLLSASAAVLIEQLLTQAETLYRQPASLHRVTKAQWEQQLWIANLDYLLTELHPHIEPVTYIRALACGMSGEAQLLPTLRAWCAALEQKKAYGTLHKLLQTLIDSSSEIGRSPTEKTASLPIDLRGLLMKMPSMEILEEIYIHNAGQVLAAPYLPRLFTMLNLVEDGVFIDRQAAERAVHLLQFMVNEQTQTPEYQLTLNKVLCGITTGIPIDNRIDISAHEKKTIEGLMLGMIQNWKTIGNTSISGLRQTFLQRKGRLHLKEDGMWYLTIEPGTFDMLLDSLPWSYSVIKHAWMERAIHVTWR